MSFEAVQQRWETFRSSIETRFHELLQEAEGVLPTLLEQSDFDTIPFGNAWQGVHQQARDLIYRIQTTWSEKVQGAFDAELDASEDRSVAFGAAVLHEQEKGDRLMFTLEKELKRYEVRVTAEAARRLRQHAQETLAKDFACTECRAPLPVRPDFFRAYHLSCEYCQRVNTFEPGTLARNVEHFALHPLAEERALDSYLAFLDLEREAKRMRGPPPPDVRTKLETAYRTYAETYLRARAELIPDYQKCFEKDLAGKMEGFARFAH